MSTGLLSSAMEGMWRGDELGRADMPTVGTGFAALDAALPGQGWPTHALTEILLPQAGMCEWRLTAPGLAPLVAVGGQLLMVAPPKRPHAAGLAQWGIDADHLVWIGAATPAERLWATEQLVKSNPKGAVLAWLPQARPEQIRRLQVHAQSCSAPVFLFRPVTMQREASAAPLRLSVALGRDWHLQVHILKRRGPPHDGVLLLRSIAAPIAAVLPPRLSRPEQPIAILSTSEEATDARVLGRAAAARLHRHPAGH
ncbi:hypothetical protein WDL1CHR_04305 [Variovorax sp. WDL1]|nr:hypothetical protein CHC07_01473 [Variovorax sp. B4]VTV13658.1 hypothetical protein WDL1CHR_04305 [Variovorax sp. WDL1]